MRTENYRDLQVYYSIHKNLVEQIVSTFAKEESEDFRVKIHYLNSLEKVVYQEVLQRITGDRLGMILPDGLELQKIIESSDYQDRLKNESKEDSVLDEEFALAKFNTFFMQSSSQHKVLSTNVRPGADNLGWIDGNSFPANHWAFTYDDGPSGINTPIIRGTYDQYGLKTTFFWLSQLTSQATLKPVIDAVKASGHDLANHSHSHANLVTYGEAGLQNEIVHAQALHTNAFGGAPKFFRCPYGSCGGNTSRIRQLIAQEQMIMVYWNVDSLDWQDHNPATVINRVRQQMAAQGHGIVLMHDIHASTAEVTKQFIPQLVQEGKVKFVSMSQITSILNQ